MEEHHLKIKKLNGEWRVVHADDDRQSVKHVKHGHKVVWTAEGTDCYFQFMDDSLTGKFKHALKDGKQIKLNIGAQARRGEHPYAVFCVPDNEFARGESPPRIIVD